ncbi:Alpha/beta knot methyltransferase [Pavlovales sp. CCMP2436]|nr:Alpha/beta knot methyltransferase [Pavlovales sp. CCMP2436]
MLGGFGHKTLLVSALALSGPACLASGARPLITSPKNALVKALRRLESKRHREREGLMVCEGLRLVCDALEAGFEAETVLVAEPLLAEQPRLRRLLDQLAPGVVLLADEAVLAAASTTVTAQGIVGAVRMPPPVTQLPDGATFVLVLDNVQDPGNVGTLVRCAAGFGCDAVVSLGNCADVWGPKALRSAMGGTFRVPVVEASDWAELRESLTRNELRIYAADGGLAARDYATVDWRQPSAVIVGNEANGLSDAIRADVADGKIGVVCIPMAAELESLNAAMAGTVLLSECSRQRRESR